MWTGKSFCFIKNLPQSFSLGLNYCPDERWQFNMEIFRDIRYKNEFCIGICYNISSQFFMRFGIIDHSNSYAIGFGTVYFKMTLDYALTIHQLLGVSHIFTFTLDL